mmetsp:Transcript_16760/g.23299  ORF Transcript_16760/g.23299 Transcript_16760/m.23299 type:complete len:85 (-) Transcript_16760:170-424(-)
MHQAAMAQGMKAMAQGMKAMARYNKKAAKIRITTMAISLKINMNLLTKIMQTEVGRIKSSKGEIPQFKNTALISLKMTEDRCNF